MQEHAQGTRILVIDNSLAVCRSIATCLEREGCAVTWIRHPRVALHALFTRQITLPAMLFVDLNLPDISGFQVIRQLRTSRDLAQTPIIAISGPNRFFNPLRVHLAGANTVVPRPLKRKCLIDLVQQYVSNPDGWLL